MRGTVVGTGSKEMNSLHPEKKLQSGEEDTLSRIIRAIVVTGMDVAQRKQRVICFILGAKGSFLEKILKILVIVCQGDWMVRSVCIPGRGDRAKQGDVKVHIYLGN